MTTPPYATTDRVLKKIDKRVELVDAKEAQTVNRRVLSATEKWVNQTGRPFHARRVGSPDDPRTWEYHDARNITTSPPVVVQLDNRNVVPVDPDKDTLEIRVGRSTWEDITDEEGDTWVADYARGQLKLFRYLLRRVPFERSEERFLRATYRYGNADPLGEDGVPTAVPEDVREAVASEAAAQLNYRDKTTQAVPDDGQVAQREARAEQYRAEFDRVAKRYTTVTVA